MIHYGLLDKRLIRWDKNNNAYDINSEYDFHGYPINNENNVKDNAVKNESERNGDENKYDTNIFNLSIFPLASLAAANATI